MKLVPPGAPHPCCVVKPRGDGVSRHPSHAPDAWPYADSQHAAVDSSGMLKLGGSELEGSMQGQRAAPKCCCCPGGMMLHLVKEAHDT